MYIALCESFLQEQASVDDAINVTHYLFDVNWDLEQLNVLLQFGRRRATSGTPIRGCLVQERWTTPSCLFLPPQEVEHEIEKVKILNYEFRVAFTLQNEITVWLSAATIILRPCTYTYLRMSKLREGIYKITFWVWQYQVYIDTYIYIGHVIWIVFNLHNTML